MSPASPSLPSPSTPGAGTIPGLRQLLRDSLVFCRQHGWAFVRPLIAPVILMHLSTYACLIGSYLYINHLHAEGSSFGWGTLATLLGIVSVTMLGFFWGAWRYVVYMASYNRSLQRLNDTGQPGGADEVDRPSSDTLIADDYRFMVQSRRWAYKNLLGAYALLGLLLLPLIVVLFVPVALFSAVTALMLGDPAAEWVATAGGTIATALGCLPLVALTFVFQIAGLEPLPRNPLPPLWQSCQLVMRAFWKTLSLHAVLLLLTCYVIPWPISALCRLVGLSLPLDAFHHWLIQDLLLASLEPDTSGWGNVVPDYADTYQHLMDSVPEVARQITDGMLMGTITLWLLPLGTHAFWQLYRALHQPDATTNA